MKPIVKQAACVLLIALAVFAYPFRASADERIEELKKEKEVYEQSADYMFEHGDHYAHLPYDVEVSNCCAVLFYTETIQKMEFAFVEDHSLAGYSMIYFAQYGNKYLQNDLIERIVFDASAGSLGFPKTSVPLLLAAVEELKIDKEELIAAKEAYAHDPYCIRDRHPELSDEDFEEIFVRNKERYNIKSFMIEALYLEDREEGIRLLCTPWTVRLGGKTLVIGDLVTEPGGEGPRIPVDEWLKLPVQSEYFLAFLEYAKEKCESESFSRYYWVDAEKTLQTIQTLKSAASAPRAGARTGVYLGAAALSASLLVGGVSILRRRKRRLA